MRRAFREAFSPRRKEEGEVLVRRDGARVLAWERTYTLLTPLFGGGVEPREADPVSVVRATAVRGHLRFWARAPGGAGAPASGGAGRGGLPRGGVRWRGFGSWSPPCSATRGRAGPRP